MKIGYKKGKKWEKYCQTLKNGGLKITFYQTKTCASNYAKKNYHPVDGGKDIKIASIFPLVCNPNFVPLSWSKLNSVYLDLR